MATPEIQTWAESEQLSVFSSQWFPVRWCLCTEVLDLFYFILQAALSLNLVYLSCSTLLSETGQCSYCCLLSLPLPVPASVLVWEWERLQDPALRVRGEVTSPQWCVWPHSFSFQLLGYVFCTSVSCEYENHGKSRDESLEQVKLSVCGHLPLSRWPKGVCMRRTPIFVGGLNIAVMLFIQSS